MVPPHKPFVDTHLPCVPQPLRLTPSAPSRTSTTGTLSVTHRTQQSPPWLLPSHTYTSLNMSGDRLCEKAPKLGDGITQGAAVAFTATKKPLCECGGRSHLRDPASRPPAALQVEAPPLGGLSQINMRQALCLSPHRWQNGAEVTDRGCGSWQGEPGFKPTGLGPLPDTQTQSLDPELKRPRSVLSPGLPILLSSTPWGHYASSLSLTSLLPLIQSVS